MGLTTIKTAIKEYIHTDIHTDCLCLYEYLYHSMCKRQNTK